MKSTELKNIAPTLFKLKKFGTGFIVPKSYFENLEDQVNSQIFIQNIKSKDSFDIPKGYFKDFENSVFEKINSEKKEKEFNIPENYFDTIEDNVLKKINSEVKVISLQSKILKTLIPASIAASILLVFSLSFFNSNNETDLMATLNTAEIENWLDNGYIDIDTHEIESLYTDEELENIELENTFDDENLINYLDDIDLESLILTN